ncbi:MAG: ParB/RepB/Spo0J family partition protein [bacterium]
MKSLGLGRGLGSLIPRREPDQAKVQEEKFKITDVRNSEGTRILEVPINIIKANPWQPRQGLNDSDEDLAELVHSIKVHGILQPLIVTATSGGNYELIAGERRLRAARLAGLKLAPIIIRNAQNQEKIELSLIENIQRKELNSIEQAIAFRRLADEFDLTHEEISKKIGKSRSVVTNMIRLLSLPDNIQQALLDGRITSAHAKLLVTLKPEEQENLFKKILKEKITTEQTEREVRKIWQKEDITKLRKDIFLESKEERLREFLGTKVSIKKSGQRGQILIDFYSDEELSEIINKIVS